MMTQKKKSITEVKQNREWGQERGFKTEEKKKPFNLLGDFAPCLQISHFYSPVPQSALPQLCQSAQLTTKQGSGSSRNLAGPPQKTHSFLSSVMTVWLHLFLDRKLKLLWIKSTVHASSNKSTVYENVNDHIFIWQIKHDTFRPLTWKRCDLNWNEPNLFWRRKRKEARDEIQNKNHLDWIGYESWKDNKERSSTNAFDQGNLCSWSTLKIWAFLAQMLANCVRLFLKEVARVQQTFPLLWLIPRPELVMIVLLTFDNATETSVLEIFSHFPIEKATFSFHYQFQWSSVSIVSPCQLPS